MRIDKNEIAQHQNRVLYIEYPQEIGYRCIAARSLLPSYKKDQEIIYNII